MERISIRAAAFSIFLSVILWLYITLQGEYDVTVPVPLELQLPANRSFDVAPPSSVYVTLRGSGWNLLNALYIDRSVRIAVELPSQSRGGTISEAELRSRFRSAVPIRVLRIEPSSIDYQLGVLVQKKVPILPRIAVTAADGHVFVPPLVLVPDTAVVVGSARVVDSLSCWPTQQLIRSNQRQTFTELIALEQSPIVRVLPEHVLVKAAIEPVGELTLYDVPVQSSLNSDEYVLPPYVTVLLRGGLSRIERLLERDDLAIRVTLPDERSNRDHELLEPIVVVPPGIQASVSPRFLVTRRIRTTMTDHAGQ
jgi:hypothetical protein